MHLSPRKVVPSTVVTDSDHGAIVTVVTAFCTTTALLFFCTRLLVRWPWQTLLGKDDFMTLVASLTCLVQMLLIICAVSAGLGKTTEQLSHASQITIDKYIYASDLLYLTTMCLSRLAVVLFFFRLEKSGKISLFNKILAWACIFLIPVSLVIIATQHFGSATWLAPSASVSRSIFARWVTVEVLGDILEVVLIAFPMYLVYQLQIQFSMKVKVVIAVALRFPILVISVFRIISLSHTLRSQNYYFVYVNTEILTQVEMSFTLISATVPTMRIFLKAAKSSLFGETVPTPSGSWGNSLSRSGTRRGSSLQWSKSREGSAHAIELTNRIGGGGETVTKVSRGSVSGSLRSDSSKRHIVLHQTVDVELNGSYGDLMEEEDES